MAYSASTGFRLRKSLIDMEPGQPLSVRVGNSATLKLGDAVRWNTAGFLVRSAVGEPVLGILTGFRATKTNDKEGINPFSLGATTTGLTLTADDQVAVSATNQTRTDLYLVGEVTVDPAGIFLFYNDANGDFAQTNEGQYFDVVSGSNQIDQTTSSDANGQFQLIERDPDNDADLSKGLFRINENQFGNALDSATAKITA